MARRTPLLATLLTAVLAAGCGQPSDGAPAASSSTAAKPAAPGAPAKPAGPPPSADSLRPPPSATPVGLAGIAPGEVRRTELWVALQGGALAAIDAASGRVLHRVEVGKKPAYVKVSPDGRLVAVTDPPTATATIVDAATGKVVATVKTGPTPKGLNWSPDSEELWVANEGAKPGTVFVYRAPAWEKVAEVHVGKAPHNVAVSDDGSLAYVTNTGSGTITVIDARSKRMQDDIPVGGAAHNLMLAPGNGVLFVTLTDRKELIELPLSTMHVAAALPLVDGHHVPATDGAGHFVVGGFGAGAASVIRADSAGRVVANDTVSLAPGAHGVAFGPGDVAYVADSSDFVAVIDPRKGVLLRKIPAKGAPFTVSVRVVGKDGKARGPSSRTAS